MSIAHRYAFQWQPDDLAAASRVLSTLMAEGIDFRHPSGMGGTTTLLILSSRGDLPAEPGDWLVSAEGGHWQVTTSPFTTSLVPSLDLPDYLNAAAHHGILPPTEAASHEPTHLWPAPWPSSRRTGSHWPPTPPPATASPKASTSAPRPSATT
ncbi:hypothetical protein ACWDV7_26910 [Streptomyces sp. NPDC003362]